MERIILIGCGTSQTRVPSPARELFIGELFWHCRAYAEKFATHRIYILSAVHGVLPPDQIISPYKVTLRPKAMLRFPDLQPMNHQERCQWAVLVRGQLSKIANLEKDTFIFLGGRSIFDLLDPVIPHIEHPLKGLSYHPAVRFLQEKIRELDQLAEKGDIEIETFAENH